MKTSPAARRGSVLKVLIVLIVLAAMLVVGVAVAGVAVYRLLTVDPDMRSIRKELLSELQIETRGRVEVKVPSIALGLARMVVPFVDVPEEGRLALRAVRGGSVGVYQLEDAIAGADRRELVERVTHLLEDREWQRTVTVIDRDQLVMVFAPAGNDMPHRFSAFVLVVNGREMVMVQGRANLEPVFTLAERHWHRHGRGSLKFN
ncbi:MAG TPA: hypothetical protein DCY13_21725 [Verrucomicrobiales bacterium]|nr:hypothetical protein [Verrucomicrobiales bacterium]